MNPIEWLRRRIKEGGADSEADTERDGAFSWSGEVHAFMIGFAVGAQDPYNWISEVPEGDDEHYQDARDEPGYFHAGSVAGTGAQLLLVGLSILLALYAPDAIGSLPLPMPGL